MSANPAGRPPRRGRPPLRGVAERNALAAANLPLVAFVIDRYFPRAPRGWLADIHQEGAAGLLRAAELFDEAAGFSFTTYATGWIRSRVGRALRGDGMIRVPEYRRGEAGGAIREALRTVPIGEADAQAAEPPDPDARLDLAVALRQLKPRDRRVIECRYSRGLTCREAGRLLGCSGTRVQQVEARALRQLRELLGEEYASVSQD